MKSRFQQRQFSLGSGLTLVWGVWEGWRNAQSVDGRWFVPIRLDTLGGLIYCFAPFLLIPFRASPLFPHHGW